MNLTGRRKSSNVDDRRTQGGGGGLGLPIGGKSLGIGGLIIVGLITWLMGGDPLSVVTQDLQGESPITATTNGYTPTAEEDALAEFSSQILAGTEDIWAAEFQRMGKTYRPPKLVLFHGNVRSGCGGATSASGPFYCSADETVYIDLAFFTSMQQQLGAGGDFAYAYVIAHEVGHHVQHLLGTLSQAHARMQQVSEKEANQISVRLELQADYYAGLWAHHDHARFQSLEAGDIEEALDAASKIGDDYLQKRAQGYTVPDSFNHGTSAQRHRWLKKGLETGNFEGGNTFFQDYTQL